MAINITNGRKMKQIAIKYVYQHLPLQDAPNFTQIVNFGLKIYHLATQDFSSALRRTYLQTSADIRFNCIENQTRMEEKSVDLKKIIKKNFWERCLYFYFQHTKTHITLVNYRPQHCFS
jgi:hypothetical protein